MATITSDVDWDAVERVYRDGKLSNVKIGREFNVSEASIRQQARRRGWIKGEPSAIREEAVRQANERTANRKPPGRVPTPDAMPSVVETGQERLEAIAAPAADVLIYHRGQASRLRSIVMKLAHELEEVTDRLPEVEGALEEYFQVKAASNPLMAAVYRQQLSFALKAVRLGDRAKIAVNLTTAFKNMVETERKSWGLDEDIDNKRGYEDILMELHNKMRELAAPAPLELVHESQAA